MAPNQPLLKAPKRRAPGCPRRAGWANQGPCNTLLDTVLRTLPPHPLGLPLASDHHDAFGLGLPRLSNSLFFLRSPIFFRIASFHVSSFFNYSPHQFSFFLVSTCICPRPVFYTPFPRTHDSVTLAFPPAPNPPPIRCAALRFAPPATWSKFMEST